MIKIIDITNKIDADAVLAVQLPSYRVEANIIGSSDIPPLKDTVHSLQHCGETFIGYYEDEELCGAIAIKVEDDKIDIHRLIVHPNHFRKGIAQSLFNFIENQFQPTMIEVATGSKNAPAISFYKKNGFLEIKEVFMKDQIFVTYFKKER